MDKPVRREGDKAICQITYRTGQSGAARLKFLIVIALIACAGYSGYQYIPVATQGYQFKDVMQQTVNKGAYGQTSDWVITQLRASGAEYGVPPNAVITAVQHDGRMESTVQFTRPVPLPGYVYQYNFNHTVKSTEFLTPK